MSYKLKVSYGKAASDITEEQGFTTKNQKSWDELSFDTKEERIAYCKGLDDANGWEECFYENGESIPVEVEVEKVHVNIQFGNKGGYSKPKQYLMERPCVGAACQMLANITGKQVRASYPPADMLDIDAGRLNGHYFNRRD